MKKLLFTALLAASFSSVAASQVVDLYKEESCGCCHLWGEAVKAAGYDVKIHDVTYQEIDKINQEANLPNSLRSCHTAKINGKLVVGHVPLDSLAKINTLPDDVAGIAVGGMPAGSLGMEQPSGFSQPYSVVSFKKDGSQSILKRY
ncbi:metal-binding protein [Providencia sp. wls1943]|uniref:DUF411 domain-containing protein n=1 Tax=unclassified Providencia TaxID=2633465 RepID=UPI0012B5B6F3|nr:MULTISPECIES: DUF411 domain-containing protein [unclassified Providencia]MTB66885.1 metal-binding protein [Providencia sp. wls1943]